MEKDDDDDDDNWITSSYTPKAGCLTLDVLETSLFWKYAEAQYIWLFHLPAEPSTDSESSQNKS